MILDLQPTLQGTMVKLRPLRHDDYTALFSVAADPLIWEQHRTARDRYMEPVFRKFFAEAISSGGALLLLDADTNMVIGTSRFAAYLPSESVVEIGWTFLARTHWGGRYNAAVKALMLAHAFGAVDSVLFRVGKHNIRSQKAVIKLGAIQEHPTLVGDADGVCFRLTRTAYNTHRSHKVVSAADALESV